MDTSVEMSPATCAALERRGGHLFISLDGAGMMHVRINEPRTAVTFETIQCDAVTLHVDSDIKRPRRWVVVYKRLPWPHFDALYDPPDSGSVFDAVTDNIIWP